MAKEALSKPDMEEASEDFESVYSANQPLIYRFMFWRTKDEMLAQDLTSSVFEKAWRTRAGFTGGSSRAWLYRIARTTLIDYWRKKKEIPDDGTIAERTASDAAELDEVMDRQLELESLRVAFKKLPQEMQSVVQSRFIEGESVRVTSKKLKLSEANVRVIQYRALKKLRGYLQ